MKITLNKQRIPKKISFIFLAKNEPMPDFFNYCANRARELHPDWEINFYNEDDALQIVENHFPELANLYNAYPLNVQRADILRILIVYLYGGFYMDLDVCCLKKLDPLLKFNVVLGEEKHLKREVCTALGLNNPKRIANYMFGSIPKHPFWLELLNEIIAKSLIEIKTENDVLESTGPGILTDFYHTKANFYKDIVLLLNKDRFCLNKYHNEIACHFGNYAAHLHAGTWRWQNGQTPKFNDVNTKSLPIPFDNSFRYKIKNRNYGSFYFNDSTKKVDSIDNHDLASILKKTAIVIENINSLAGKRVVLYGPICRYMEQDLPENAYVYISNTTKVAFTPNEVNFINNRFSCCIVSDLDAKKYYESNGIVITIQIIEPGFRRYKRDLENEQNIDQFKLGCFADRIDSLILRELLCACKNLQKQQIPAIKIKLYDPYNKFKDFHEEFDEAGLVEYMPIIVSDDYFSSWFNDIALAIVGHSDEPYPVHILEFLYLGIPIIVPDTDNYKRILEKITENPAIFISSLNNVTNLDNSVFTSENIARVILNVYREYDHYCAKAINAAAELEDVLTVEETEQNILSLISQI